MQWPKVTFELDILFELFILLILLQKFPDSFLDFILPKRMSQSATLPRRQKKKRRRMDHPDGPGWSWRALLLTDQACCALACPWRPGRQEWESAPPPDPGTTWRRPLHATTVIHQSHLALSIWFHVAVAKGAQSMHSKPSRHTERVFQTCRQWSERALHRMSIS